MVAVAQSVESRIVIPVVVGSSPISHPIFSSFRLFAAEQALLLTLPFFFFFGCPFVVLFFALGKTDFQLDPPSGVMQIDGYQRVSGAFYAANQPVDFFCVQQQFARAGRIRMHMQ